MLAVATKTAPILVEGNQTSTLTKYLPPQKKQQCYLHKIYTNLTYIIDENGRKKIRKGKNKV